MTSSTNRVALSVAALVLAASAPAAAAPRRHLASARDQHPSQPTAPASQGDAPSPSTTADDPGSESVGVARVLLLGGLGVLVLWLLPAQIAQGVAERRRARRRPPFG